jgi:hypothetical protein
VQLRQPKPAAVLSAALAAVHNVDGSTSAMHNGTLFTAAAAAAVAALLRASFNATAAQGVMPKESNSSGFCGQTLLS